MGKDTACNYLLNKKYKILFYMLIPQHVQNVNSSYTNGIN